MNATATDLSVFERLYMFCAMVGARQPLNKKRRLPANARIQSVRSIIYPKLEKEVPKASAELKEMKARLCGDEAEWSNELEKERVSLIKKQYQSELTEEESGRLNDLMKQHGQNRRALHGNVIKERIAELDRMIENLEIIRGIRPVTKTNVTTD